MAILAVLIWRLGTGPFVSGLRAVSGWSLAAAAGIMLLTTICSAWRWMLVARGLGVPLGRQTAIAAYYRSQFLNTVLPGGVLGDVHRAVRHGRDAGDVRQGVRAVAWERVAGQVVQVAIAAAVLAVLPSPVRGSLPVIGAVGASGVLVAAAAVRIARSRARSRIARTLQSLTHDARSGVLARRAWLGITLASAAVVTGHTATFLIAARTAGTSAPLDRLLPVAMLVILAMALPTNIAGWGPREGVAAWSFGAAGFGVDHGVATATVYGILVLAASMPGAVVLAASRGRSDTHGSRGPVVPPALRMEVTARGW